MPDNQAYRRLTAVEVFGTSWIHDLMLAKQYAPADWVQPDSTLTGTVDANYGYTVGGHNTHDLGMAMDLGISHYIDYSVQKLHVNTPSQIVTSVPTSGQWSMADAQALLDAMISDANNRQDLALADFFSLYAVTQNGVARDALAAHVSNATALNALFGDGTQANGLINGVIIGGTVGSMNTYPDMRYALQQLGFREGAVPQANTMPSLQNMTVHYNHFHIYLQPPKLEPIHATNLLMVADAGNASDLVTSSDTLMLADAAAKTITPEIVRKINKELANSCSASENPSYSQNAALGGLSPGVAVVGILKYDYGIEVSGEVKAVITQQPAHGKIAMIGLATRSFPGLSLEEFQYTPDKDFLGEDKAVIEVTANGQKFRLSYTIKVVHGGFNDACMPPGADSGTLIPDVQIAIDDIQFLQDASAPDVATSWQSLFAQTEQIINSINVNFADLAGGAVGQTTGEGINATITLDNNAAGNNWFIDTTPSDNSEFLPTSNPNEWVAKAGSEAAGKMDMLSVLLHEYGHALGIEHSADSGDYMGTTLTVGVRRLPSATELALMQQLIAQAKGEMTGTDSYASTPTLLRQAQDRPSLPLQGGGGLPLDLPISLGGLAFAGLLRPNRYGSLSIDLAAPATQYEAAANATFTNLDTANAWQTQGSVDITPSSFDTSGRTVVSSATLNEVSTSQTRLSQVFMLNDNDRYLSFTLAGSVLDNPLGAPEDAFEVALLDASTGASVLSGDGLTRSDAFLNLQGDGTQNAADCVTCIYNADGSRTYRVDLTAVNGDRLEISYV